MKILIDMLLKLMQWLLKIPLPYRRIVALFVLIPTVLVAIVLTILHPFWYVITLTKIRLDMYTTNLKIKKLIREGTTKMKDALEQLENDK